MDLLLKSLNGSGALAGLAAAVVIIATFGLGWLKLMRELQGDKDRAIEQKDRDLADFRRENEALKIRVKSLLATAAKLENRTVQQGAVLYGNVVYIRRLEKGYRERSWTLPPRNGPDENG